MASAVLLINANRCTTPYPVYPLGLGYLSTALTREGHRVAVTDFNVEPDRITEIISHFAPDYIGISIRNVDDVNSSSPKFFIPDLIELINLVRTETQAPIILGGSAFSLFPEKILALTKAEYGICGEGEISFPQLIKSLEKSLPDTSIQGLAFKVNRAVKVNPVLGYEKKLQNIPVPQRPQNLVDYYLSQSRMLNIQSQRGCAFQCCYCTYPVIEGTSFRFRPPEEVAEEIEAGLKQNCRYFFFVDSVFNTSPNHVRGICEEIIRRNLQCKWSCFLRPKNLNSELFSLMKRAGLEHIEFGSDSFSDPVLDRYQKHFTFNDILESSTLAWKHKIWYSHFLIIGGPGETYDTIHQSFENAQRLKNTVVFPYIGMRIYPGTALYETALKEKIISHEQSLLEPFFYLAPGLSMEKVTALMEQFAEQSPQWLFGDFPPEFDAIVKKLRERGVEGPLWEYLIRLRK